MCVCVSLAASCGGPQRQHLELARDICRRFNDKYPLQAAHSEEAKVRESQKNVRNNYVFKEPEALVMKEGARLMSLLDGGKKKCLKATNQMVLALIC